MLKLRQTYYQLKTDTTDHRVDLGSAHISCYGQPLEVYQRLPLDAAPHRKPYFVPADDIKQAGNYGDNLILVDEPSHFVLAVVNHRKVGRTVLLDDQRFVPPLVFLLFS